MKFYAYLKSKTQAYIPRLCTLIIQRYRLVLWPSALSLSFLGLYEEVY